MNMRDRQLAIRRIRAWLDELDWEPADIDVPDLESADDDILSSVLEDIAEHEARESAGW
jgi:hypothetical protein